MTSFTIAGLEENLANVSDNPEAAITERIAVSVS